MGVRVESVGDGEGASKAAASHHYHRHHHHHTHSRSWIPGKTLLPIVEAAQRGTVVMYLLSDAAQKELWPQIKPTLTPGKTLYFSHGFSIAFKEDTGACGCRDGRGNWTRGGQRRPHHSARSHSDPPSSRVGLAKSNTPCPSRPI